MDPDAALDELLGLIGLMADVAGAGDEEQIDRCEILRMTELVEALDSWLAIGGFLPRRWQPASQRKA